mmetsp:Transcript_68920/g.121830  ORF Transcript_68920/g.121830 Transcript_68920/m.121830 type:complete len:614 (-) Transcript_68920:220-2061(-)|eukprot:CAMPEP_0197683652 /NCGR_PEP_ID=MMETSP1338-20131121/98288_1 /TAXON_ID=43686 ORGANISM="Pelagodinium beii, Strain RCC1491" /NCGR_SAMPLE_ID=MMETSP1338 /ASSEMBLY_ACC=CAM_ASM_000754 /LENGTH=613 /DNA_ID=CAMNT_0043265267 /DNA_START=44 /DNA_END=1885 /DNA_ORIENTATION=+
MMGNDDAEDTDVRHIANESGEAVRVRQSLPLHLPTTCLALGSWSLLILLDLAADATNGDDFPEDRWMSFGTSLGVLAVAFLLLLMSRLQVLLGWRRRKKRTVGLSSVVPMVQEDLQEEQGSEKGSELLWHLAIHGMLVVGALCWLLLNALQQDTEQVWRGLNTLYCLISLACIGAWPGSGSGGPMADIDEKVRLVQDEPSSPKPSKSLGSKSSFGQSSPSLAVEDNAVPPVPLRRGRWKHLFKDPTFNGSVDCPDLDEEVSELEGIEEELSDPGAGFTAILSNRAQRESLKSRGSQRSSHHRVSLGNTSRRGSRLSNSSQGLQLDALQVLNGAESGGQSRRNSLHSNNPSSLGGEDVSKVASQGRNSFIFDNQDIERKLSELQSKPDGEKPAGPHGKMKRGVSFVEGEEQRQVDRVPSEQSAKSASSGFSDVSEEQKPAFPQSSGEEAVILSSQNSKDGEKRNSFSSSHSVGSKDSKSSAASAFSDVSIGIGEKSRDGGSDGVDGSRRDQAEEGRQTCIPAGNESPQPEACLARDESKESGASQHSGLSDVSEPDRGAAAIAASENQSPAGFAVVDSQSEQRPDLLFQRSPSFEKSQESEQQRRISSVSLGSL